MFTATRSSSYAVASACTIGALLSGATAPVHAQEGENDSEAVVTLDALRDGSLVIESGDDNATSRGPSDEFGDGVQLATLVGDESVIVDASLQENGALAATTPGFVDLSWEAVDGPRSYAIFRDDVLLAETTGNTFRDDAVEPGAIYGYRIQTVAMDNGTVIPDDEVTVRGFEIAVPESGDFASEVAELNKALAAKAAYTGSTPRIPGGPRHCPHDARRQPSDGRGLTGSSKSVGATTVYNSEGTKVATKTASTNDMSVSQLGKDKNSVDLRFRLKAGNPFCSGTSIQGAFTITVTKNGAYSIISGSHRQMPTQEVYVKSLSGDWKTVYQRTYANPICLVGWACPEVQMAGYGNY